MKIVHICLAGTVTDGLTYQENLLSKYHKKMGHTVSFITTRWVYNSKGKIETISKTNYYNDDGILMIRLHEKKNVNYDTKLKRFEGVSEALEKCNPDVIFIHNLHFCDITSVVKYLKSHTNVKVYIDNHCDYANSARNFLSKYVLHRIIWRHYAKMIEPYVTKFYGVLPARVDFLVENYHLPKNKCEVLLLGADDEIISEIKLSNKREILRKKFNIMQDDFLIVTGGKIDKFKLQTLLLMKAVQQITNEKVKLLIFGSIEESIVEQFNELCDGEKIKYVGWAKGNESYEYFSMADLVVFPGGHSVYWEQTVAQGIPMLCNYWNGTTHIDIGGNVSFLYDDSVEEIKNKLEELIAHDFKAYLLMKEKANAGSKEQFLYSNIAKKSIQ